MKKELYIFLILLSAVMLRCETPNNYNNNKTRVRVEKANEAYIVPPPLAPITDGALLDRDSVNIMIANYINTHDTIPGTSSYFTINTATLLEYLNDAKNLNAISYVHAALYLQIENGDTSLGMALAGVDELGNYAYIEKDGRDTFFVLNCTPSPDASDLDTLEIPSRSTPATGRIKKIFPERMKITSANKLIDSFIEKNARGMKNTTASSFLINADDLYNYASAYSKTDQIQFYLGDDHGRLTLITTVLVGKEHIYFLDNHLENCVLERAMPCPECELPDEGMSLGKLSVPSKRK